MVDGSVTVTLKTPPPDPLFIGICSGRPSDVPNSVADVAWRLPHVTWNVTEVPAVKVDGLAKATAAPGGFAVAASAGSDISAGPDTAAAMTHRPSAAAPARLLASLYEAANRCIGRMNVPPPKTAQQGVRT